MRDRIEIEREMNVARQDLEDSLAALKHALREKLDLPARARVAIARRVESARRAAPMLLALTVLALLVLVFARRRS